VPDLMAFGKKVQVCGTAARLERLQEVDHVFKVSSRINSTFGGHIVDMVRTTQVLEIIEEENLLSHCQTLGEWMKAELIRISNTYPVVSNVRGLGLWMAFDLPSTEARNEAIRLCWENGLIV